MTRRSVEVKEFLMRLESAAAKLGRDVAFMEVCGTHTVNAFRCGLHSLMPPNVTLLSGPGCPVCVTAQGDVDQMIQLAARPGVTLCTYGDMLRVTGTNGSLELSRMGGADIRVIYSAMDAVKLAADEPRREVVLVAVGFETTAPATAIAVLEAHRRGLKNFTALVTHKLVLPAMRALLDGVPVKLDGFLCPGHVSVIIGADVFAPIVQQYRKPCVIVGFEDLQLAAGLCRLVELALAGTPRLENLYPQAVSPRGNARAQEVLDRVFEPVEARPGGDPGQRLGHPPGAGGVRRSATVRAGAGGCSRAAGLSLWRSDHRPMHAARLHAVWHGLHAGAADRPVHGEQRRDLPGVVQV